MIADRERSFCDVAHPFPAENTGKAGAVEFGPESNTGQKVLRPAAIERQHAVTVDFLTVVFNRDRLEACRKLNLRYLLQWIFGLDPRDVFMGQIHAKRWQYYKSSAPIIDANGELVGRFGCEGNGDTMCVSLSGAACRYIRNWRHVEVNLAMVGARMSRCDIAYDDYDGVLGTVREHEALVRQNLSDTGGCMLFASGGTPPKTRFMDDHGNGDGCTLYVYLRKGQAAGRV
jgi:phage replication initiation protein